LKAERNTSTSKSFRLKAHWTMSLHDDMDDMDFCGDNQLAPRFSLSFMAKDYKASVIYS